MSETNDIACEDMKNLIERLDKYLNIKADNYIKIKKNKRGINMAMREVGVIVGSQFAGYGVKELGSYVDGIMGKTAAPSFQRPSTWIDIVGGLFLSIYPQFSRTMGTTTKNILTIIGTQRLAERIVTLAKEYTAVPTAAPARVRYVAPVRRVITTAAPTTVTVD